MQLFNSRPNAWLCGQPCNIRKSQIFGRKSNKKYLILLCLQLHGPKTAAQLADFLGKIYTRYRFHHAGVSQMLAGFVAKGLVIRHKSPICPEKRGATYEIDHKLPLENLAPTSL
jgi:DNA-binding MarR family transcriptional regulator